MMNYRLFLISLLAFILTGPVPAQTTQQTKYVESITFNNSSNWSGQTGAIGLPSSNSSCTSGSRISGTEWAEFSFGNFSDLEGKILGIEICPKYSAGAGTVPLVLRYNDEDVGSKTMPRRSGSSCSSTQEVCFGSSTDDWSAALVTEDFKNGEVTVRVVLNYSNANVTLDYISLTVYTDGGSYAPDCSGAQITGAIVANNQCNATISGDNVTGVTDLDSRPTISVSPQFITYGDNLVTITAIDADNNMCQKDVTVTVVDNTLPKITCHNITVSTDIDLCGANVTVPMPTVTDNCKNEGFSLYNDYTQSGDANGFYPLGQTQVVWTVTDIGGNQRSCTQKITVVDSVPPTITCADTTVTSDPGTCDATIVLDAPTVFDNCAVSTIFNNFGTLGSAISFPPGETTVIWTATDANNNQSSCSMTVTVTAGPGCLYCADPDFNNSYIDVEQNIGSARISSGLDKKISQSFVATSNGALAEIKVWFGSGFDAMFHGGSLNLYADEGLSKHRLFSMDIPENSGESTFDVSVFHQLLLTGHTYTIEIEDTLQVFEWTGSDNNSYESGTSSEGAQIDQRFAIYLAGCTEIQYTTQDKNWTAAEDSSWNNPNNWSPVGVPTVTNVVIIDNSVPGPVIDSGVVANANTIHLENFSVLTIDSNAILFIEGAETLGGIYNNIANVRNYGKIYIGRALPLGSLGVYNLGAFENYGTLEIQNSNSGIYSVTNNSFIQNAGGLIRISSSTRGIYAEGGRIENLENGSIEKWQH